MSPRRKIEAAPEPPQGRRVWAAVLGAALAVIVAAVVVCSLVLVTHEQHRRAAFRDIEAVDYVRSFMVEFTSRDPFNANAYVERVAAHGTGQFGEDYRARMPEALISVARGEPSAGEVLAAAVERWNADGSANVVVLTETVTTMPDGSTIEDGGRWVATTIQEGEQWKISNLMQVI